MPFRDAFDCLWCGRPHRVRDAGDVEGWAQLCPDCVGKAGENGFLRFRLKAAIVERGRAQARPMDPTDATDLTRATDASDASGPTDAIDLTRATDATDASGPTEAAEATDATERPATGAASVAASRPPGARPNDPPEIDPLGEEMVAYYAARAPEYDDFYLRRGRYERGPIHDTAWQAELDQATRWLDAQPISGEIVELAGGTGWWSPLLAQKGQLSVYDRAEEALDLARDRLLAHRLRAHLHVRDAWAEPDRQVDALFAGFWLSHVPRERLTAFLAVVRRWLKPGGQFLFVDSRRDPQGLPEWDRPESAPDVQVRSIRDGRQFRVVKVFYEAEDLEGALRSAGFRDVDVRATDRFFLLGRSVAA